MGGKTSTSTSQVQIPPEVLARYNSVNQTAQDVAQTPFQQYSTSPNAFVAPLTPTQTSGIENTNAAAGMAQPYFGAATGFSLAGSQPVNAAPLDTSAYMNPYLQTVLGSTERMVNQQNQQAMAGQTGQAIDQGYFGGDRSGIAAAVLAGQQQLTGGQLYSGIASDAYQQALAAAQQQQGVQLGAAQANRQAMQQTGQTLAELGTGAQGAAISGAQAQLGAGQVEQQTEQAGKTALYNQFLQQQSYPFQTAQFLANIAEGTGALSGNTTSSTQPGGLFSDERLKEDMTPIGKGFDGANIYRFRYKGDPTTRIGMSAQEVEQRHPEAVSEHAGFKAVDYGAATDDAARRGFALAANDDFPDDEAPRRMRQAGGMSGWGMYPAGVNPMSIGELLQAQAQMYGPGFEGAGLYGSSPGAMPHGGSSYVPAPMQGQPMMIHGTQPPMPTRTTPADALHSAAGLSGDVAGLESDAKDVRGGWNWLNQNVGAGSVGGSGTPFDASVAARRASVMREPDPSGADQPVFARGGFARADGGGLDPSDPQNDNPYQAHGPGLNIPTAETQHPQLQTAKPPSAGGGGSALGDISSMASIGADLTKIIPFMLALKRGGRAGFAAGGEPLDVADDLSPDDPVLAGMLHPIRAPAMPQAAAPGMGPGAPETPTGGPGAGGAPPAGFAGARPPGAPAAAAAPGFGGAGGDRARTNILALEGTAKNPRSSAVGPGQFIDSTFKRMFRKTFPDRAAGMSDADILALRKTPEGDRLSTAMIPALDEENASALQAAGFPATPVNRHLAWVLGSGGAKKVLGADPATPLIDLVGRQAVEANPRIMAGKTAGDFVGWAARGMNRAKGGFAGARRGFQDGGDTDTVDSRFGFDPAVVEQAKQAANDPATVAKVQQNREAAAQGDPSAPPAAKAAVAQGSGVGAGLAGAAQNAAGAPDASRGGADYLTPSEQRAAASYINTDRMTRQQTGQGDEPQGGGFLSRAGHWLMQPEHAIPLATGLADMLAAPTRYPLVALTQGLKGGANAYQAQRAYDLSQAQKDAELGMAQENIEGGVLGQRAGMITAQTGALTQAQAIFEGQWRPFTGPDGLPHYVGPGGETLDQQGYLQRKNAFLRDAIRRMGGTASPAGPISALSDTTGGGGAGPPPTGVAAGAGSSLPSGMGANPPGPAVVSGGGPGSGSAGIPSGNAAAVPGVDLHGEHAAGTAPAVAAKPGRSFAERLTQGAYDQLPVPRPTPDYTGLDPGSNPQALRTKAANERAWGNTTQADADMKLADGIEHGQTQAFSNGQPDMRFVDLAQAQARYGAANDQAIQQQSQNVQAAHEWLAHSGQTEQALRQANDIYATLNSNVSSPEYAQLIGKIRSIPMMDGFTPDSWKEFQSHVERGEKVQALQQINQVVGGLGHAPGAGLHVTGLATPSPGQSPGTRYSIVHQQWEQYLRDQQYMSDVANHGGHVLNWTKFNTDWAHDHPPEAFDAEATKQIGPSYFAGMLPSEKAAHPLVPKTQAELNALPKGVPVYWKGKVQWTQ